MSDRPLANPPRRPAAAVTRHLPGALALLLACGFAVMLGTRTLGSPDLGYHLAYGESFLDTGEVVDTNDFIYTLPSGPGESPRPEPAPGCWYDEAGRYRFANANWLSQVIMAAVNRRFRAAGLCALQAALVAGIFALTLASMRRLKLPAVWAAGGILLLAMVAYGRLNLRPELFGYLILAAQLCVLVGDRCRWKSVAVLIGLQLVLVNVHSYFLLGLGLTGVAVVDVLVRLLWRRLRPATAENSLRPQAIALAVAFCGQLAVCFVNPWGWRLAALPVQTLVFLRTHNIAGAGSASPHAHPWSLIGEFFHPFATGAAFLSAKATYAFCLLLALSVVGAVAAAIRRQWRWLLLIAAMTAVSLSMRRNIAPAALLIIPPALSAVFAIASRLSARPRPQLRAVAAAVICCISAYLIFAVATQRFYYNERSPVRFGVGISRLNVPTGPAAWLNVHKPTGRMWTCYTSSSNLHYFTSPHRQVPILTNTWAYPPAVMQSVLDYCSGRRPFSEAVSDYSIEIVALLVDRATAPLIWTLRDDPAWALVYIDGRYLVFLKADGENASAAERHRITADNLDLASYRARLEEIDPAEAHSLHVGGLTLYRLGWYSAAADILAAAVEHDPSHFRAWNLQGLCLANRARRRLRLGDMKYKQDFRRARLCFLKALAIQPGHEYARGNLLLVEDDLRRARSR